MKRLFLGLAVALQAGLHAGWEADTSKNPPPGAEGEVIVVETSESGIKPLNELVFGLNLNVKHALAGRKLDDSLMLTRPTIIRYPGGTWSACWDWRNQTVFPEDHVVGRMNKHAVWMEWISRAKPEFDKPASKKLTRMDRFVAMAEEVEAEISWVLNFNSDTVESAIEMVDHIHAEGYPLKYIELGNEYNGASFNRRFRTVTDYLREARPIVEHIKLHYPHTRMAYPSNIPIESHKDADQTERMDAESLRHQEWDQVIAGLRDGVQLVDHHYIGFPPHKEEQLREDYERFTAAGQEEQIRFYLAAPYLMLKASEAFMDSHAPTDKTIWVTEFNQWLNSGPTRAYVDTMINALYMASWQLYALDSDRIELAHWHSLVGGNFGFVDIEGGTFSVSPAVQVFSHLSRLARSAETITVPVMSPQPRRTEQIAWAGASAPVLQAVQFNGESRKTMVLLNLHSRSLAVRLPGYERPSQVVCITSPDPMENIRKPYLGAILDAPMNQPVGLSSLDWTQDGQIELPPYSLTIVERL